MSDQPSSSQPPAEGAGQPVGPQAQYAQAPSAQPQYQAQYEAQYPPPPYQTGGYAQPYPKNDLAVWSFVLGLAGLVLGCLLVTGIPAVILGRNAQRAVAAGEANNGGMATAGIILGWVSIALTVAVVVLFGFLLVLGVALPFAISGSSSVG
ncbi:DUF4190 domain-containing protein [Cellulomonas soli]